MKRSYNEYLLPLLALAGTWLTACSEDGTDPANPYEGNFTLMTQAEVDAFPARREANRITVTGGDITDLSSLDVSAVGTLVIRNTGIGTLTLPKTFSVATKLEIAENESLVSVGDLALRFVIGDIHIEDNPQLTDISGLMNLKKMTGKLFVTGNSLLGEDKPDQPDTYGFNVIKYLISNSVLDSDNVTLSNNHPLAVTDPSLIGQGGESGGVYSYTIKSDAEAAAFSPSGKEVKDLTVTGPQVTDDGMALLASKIDVVQGTMTIDVAAITTTETFFGKVECRGGIVLRNIETYDEDSGNKFFNNNGFKNITQIGGDFVLENIPYLIHWGSGNGFAQIVRVEGDLTVRNCGMQQMAFASLSEVGGDMTLETSRSSATITRTDWAVSRNWSIWAATSRLRSAVRTSAPEEASRMSRSPDRWVSTWWNGGSSPGWCSPGRRSIAAMPTVRPSSFRRFPIRERPGPIRSRDGTNCWLSLRRTVRPSGRRCRTSRFSIRTIRFRITICRSSRTASGRSPGP